MTVQVAARPDAVTFEPSTAAVVVVDMQHDFASRGGMFDLAGIDVVGNPGDRAGGRGVYSPRRGPPGRWSATCGWGSPTISVMLAFRHRRRGSSTCPCVPAIGSSPLMAHRVGSWCAAPGTPRSSTSWRQPTPTWSSTSTATAASTAPTWRTSFAARGVETLIVVGATTSVCVESTVRDAMARDFHCIVVEDAVAEPIGAGLARSNHEASMLTMELLFAWITNSEQIVDAFASEGITPARSR